MSSTPEDLIEDHDQLGKKQEVAQSQRLEHQQGDWSIYTLPQVLMNWSKRAWICFREWKSGLYISCFHCTLSFINSWTTPIWWNITHTEMSAKPNICIQLKTKIWPKFLNTVTWLGSKIVTTKFTCPQLRAISRYGHQFESTSSL